METVYIVKFADYDGYKQVYQTIGTEWNDVAVWMKDGSLSEGDIIYECKVAGTVEKQLIVKEPE